MKKHGYSIVLVGIAVVMALFLLLYPFYHSYFRPTIQLHHISGDASVLENIELYGRLASGERRNIKELYSQMLHFKLKNGKITYNDTQSVHMDGGMEYYDSSEQIEALFPIWNRPRFLWSYDRHNIAQERYHILSSYLLIPTYDTAFLIVDKETKTIHKGDFNLTDVPYDFVDTVVQVEGDRVTLANIYFETDEEPMEGDAYGLVEAFTLSAATGEVIEQKTFNLPYTPDGKKLVAIQPYELAMASTTSNESTPGYVIVSTTDGEEQDNHSDAQTSPENDKTLAYLNTFPLDSLYLLDITTQEVFPIHIAPDAIKDSQGVESINIFSYEKNVYYMVSNYTDLVTESGYRTLWRYNPTTAESELMERTEFNGDIWLDVVSNGKQVYMIESQPIEAKTNLQVLDMAKDEIVYRGQITSDHQFSMGVYSTDYNFSNLFGY